MTAGDGGGTGDEACEGLWCDQENRIKCEGGKCVPLEENECWPACDEGQTCLSGTCVPNVDSE